MAKLVEGKSQRSDLFFIGQDFAVRIVPVETVQAVYFCFGAKPANLEFETTLFETKTSQQNFLKKLKRLIFVFCRFQR